MKHAKLYKAMLSALAIVLLIGVSQAQRVLNRERDQLGLTRVTPLENAPPVLAFTTVALGGFRGLISNALWIRANDLQDDGKYFEMVQLADWITKLEPHFTQVWLVQAWNMAYNISVKFKDAPDRWRWVKSGLELLRDDGLRYNPNETLIYRELAWFFQHKMGANLDDAHMYYKQQWANEMSSILGTNETKVNWDALIHPTTEGELQRTMLLTNKYKMDPKFMKEVNDHYGPLEWRLPEAHAIYWAALGLEKAKLNERKINPEELITLRRVIYQSMQLSFQRGRLVANRFQKRFEFGPNLDIIPKVSAAYEQQMAEDEKDRDHIGRGHKNFLKDAVYFLYANNREKDAAYWFKYLRQKYPDALPAKQTLDEYAVSRVQEEVGDKSPDRTEAMLEGMLASAFYSWAIDEDDRAEALDRMVKQYWTRFQSEIKGSEGRVGLRPLSEIKKIVLDRLLDPENGFPFEMRAVLRTKLRMPAESAPAPATTNAPPAAAAKP
ncbi:MAG: hypothetical protein HY298_26740 [Verrucomicrobia bacterium]|nr:hypothetical protein [Verrucomicrobiota bacterium]